MFQRAITLQEFADIFDDLEVIGCIREGIVWVTTGNHPQLGSIVAIQDMAPGILLHSELPVRESMFADSGEAAERLQACAG